jgi:F0F1-type ATP synthase delta subunit
LRAEIGQTLGKTVVLTTKVNPAILGGITLRVGDQLIDASVATRLKKMNARLADAGRAYAKTAVKAA